MDVRRLLGLTLLCVACGSSPKPSPPPIQPQLPSRAQSEYTVAVVVQDDDTNAPLAGIDYVSGEHDATTNKDGYAALQLPTCLSPDCGWLIVSGDGYIAQTIRFQNDHNQDIHVRLKADAPILPRLVAQGQHFATTVGRFTAIEASDFLLYQRFLNGEDLRPVLQQRKDAGMNMVRVFGMVNGSLGRFIPGEYPAYFTSLPAFYKQLARYGLYGEFAAFADATVAMPGKDAQLAHWNQLVTALQPITNALLEAVNESDQVINRLDALNVLPRPQGVFSSHGSNGSQAWPPTPHWDYATFHTNDAPEWTRKVGHNAMEIWTGPTLANENTRAPDRFSSPQQAFDAAAGAALLAAGSCFHSQHGKDSTLWDATEYALAQAWANGAKSVPLDCQDGAYKHPQDLESAGILRAYQRGDDPRCVVTIHK